MLKYEKEYNEEIITKADEYTTSIEEFEEWLNESTERKERFYQDLRMIDNDFFIAYDYSIIVTIVKHYREQIEKSF